jgi:RNA polymerase-binding transcription factor DksA
VGTPEDRHRNQLEVNRTQLQEQLASLDPAADEVIDDNFADTALVAAEQDEYRSLSVELREQLRDVEDAIERLDAGTYGVCAVCGEAIADERLEAVPATRTCITHAV